MKTTNKKYKLGLILTGLILSTTSVCITDFKKPKTIKDVKTELKSLSLKEEKAVSEQVIILKPPL